MLCCACSPQVSRGDVEVLVDTFPGQSIDFFGALRARVYDDKVRGNRGLALCTPERLTTDWAVWVLIHEPAKLVPVLQSA